MGSAGLHAAPAQPSRAVPVIAVAGGLGAVPAAVLVTGLACAATALAAVFLAALLTGAGAILRKRLRYLLWAGCAAPLVLLTIDDFVPFRLTRWPLGIVGGLCVACMGVSIWEHYDRRDRQREAERATERAGHEAWQATAGRMSPVVAGDAGPNAKSLPARVGQIEEELAEMRERSRAYVEWRAEQDKKTGAIADIVLKAYDGTGIEPPDALRAADPTQPLPKLRLLPGGRAQGA